MRFQTLVVLALCCGPSAACVFQITRGDPHPNVTIAESKHTLTLAIDPAIQDRYKIPRGHGMVEIDISDWHATLGIGFYNGFQRFFELVEPPKAGEPNPDYTIELDEARTEATPLFSGDGRIIAVKSDLRYRARLIDARGVVIATSTGTVNSKRSGAGSSADACNRSPWDDTRSGAPCLTDDTSGAVEALYEQIAKDFFAVGTGGRDPHGAG